MHKIYEKTSTKYRWFSIEYDMWHKINWAKILHKMQQDITHKDNAQWAFNVAIVWHHAISLAWNQILEVNRKIHIMINTLIMVTIECYVQTPCNLGYSIIFGILCDIEYCAQYGKIGYKISNSLWKYHILCTPQWSSAKIFSTPKILRALCFLLDKVKTHLQKVR